MSKWARLVDGRVVETTDIDPTGRFHESIVWTACGDEVEQNYTFNGTVFAPPAPPPLTTAVDLAPGRTLEGLTPEEVASFEELANIINTNAEALRTATENTNG